MPPRTSGFLLVLIVALIALLAAPAAATTDPVTGDVSDPEVVSFAAAPVEVDVTQQSQVVEVSARIVDAGTGVEWVSLHTTAPNAPDIAYGMPIERVSGDRFDGVYRGEVTIPNGGAPGQWELFIGARDGVGNDRTYAAADLVAAGWPGYVSVTSTGADLEPPDVAGAELVPGMVDVRTGPASLVVRVRLTDAGSGVASATVSAKGPHARAGIGGVGGASLQLVSGTASDGVWQGTLHVQRYAHAGQWQLTVGARDARDNGSVTGSAQLAEAGWPSTFEVISEQDVTPPAFRAGRLSAPALDVSRADQELALDLSVGDDLSGVHDYWWGASHVTFQVQHALNVQYAVAAPRPRLTGDGLSGTYRPVLTLPRSSATGPWNIRAFSVDSIGNEAELSGEQLVQLGIPPTVLVYNTPLPPLDIRVRPGDGSALVEWAPPSDERGAEVVEYVVRELAQGQELRVAAAERALLVPNLQNGVEHRFVVHAVNRAGESDASAAAAVVPEPGATVPAQVRRLFGNDRVETAVAVSQDGFAPDGARAVVLSRSDDFADALGGTALAAATGGPLLITGTARLDVRVRAEMDRVLRPGATVYLLGGERALSAAVEQGLRTAGYAPVRVAGADRYATAVAIAETTTAVPSAILLATGRSFADALGAGAAAGGVGGVVLLTDDTRLPASTAAYLRSHAGVPQTAVGGPAAASLASATPVVGRDRYETAVMLTQHFPGNGTAVAVATGERFPDALSGGAHAARRGVPLLLTPRAALPASLSDHLAASTAREGFVYGGAAAVDPDVLTRMQQLLE